MLEADQSLKSKVTRNIARLLLSIDPPNIVEAEKLMEEEHCLELSQGTASRSTILFKMKISLLRGLQEEALRLAKFLVAENQPIQRIEADIEMISSLLEMDLKKQLPDVGFAGKLNLWAGCWLTRFFRAFTSSLIQQFRSFSRTKLQLQFDLRRWASISDLSAHYFHVQFSYAVQNNVSRCTNLRISILFLF